MINGPMCSLVCFPSLKTLHLDRVRSLNDLSVRKLISSCLVLENLLVMRDETDKVTTFGITAPKLKSLKIYYLDHNYAIAPERVLDIGAPTL